MSPYRAYLQNVKRLDYAHYFSSRYLPPAARVCCVLTRALNIELASVHAKTSRADTARVRLVWWKNAIKTECFGPGPPSNPLIKMLKVATQELGLTRTWMLNMVAARLRDLDKAAYDTLDELEEFVEIAYASSYYLTLDAMAIRDPRVDHVASHVGRANGLVAVLKALPFQVDHRHIPRELLQRPHDELASAVSEIVARAHQHIERARHLHAQSTGWPATAHLAFLSASFDHAYLHKLRRADFNTAMESTRHAGPATLGRVAIYARLGWF